MATNKSATDKRSYADISSAFNMSTSEINADIASLLKSNLIYDREDIAVYSKFNRFGYFDPYTKLTQTKEYLFFTKPNCHIWKPTTTNLQSKLAADQFFIDLSNRYPHVIQQLQRSAGKLSGQDASYTRSPFMNLLSNTVTSTLDLPALNASEMEGANNLYGSHINYRKDAWTGDENVEFSLEFEDTKFLEVYMLAKAYEEHARYKTAGIIYPSHQMKETGSDGHVFCNYIKRKELSDTMGIFKFIVDETYENIVYYAYVCGAYINSVPRDAFNDLKSGDGLTFSIDFKAYCVIDMDPLILYHFNKLVNDRFKGSKRTYKPIYNVISGDDNRPPRAKINGDWVAFPRVVKSTIRSSETGASGSLHPYSGAEGMGYIYRLVWY